MLCTTYQQHNHLRATHRQVFVTTTIGSGYLVLNIDAGNFTAYDPQGLINSTDNSVTITQAGTYSPTVLC